MLWTFSLDIQVHFTYSSPLTKGILIILYFPSNKGNSYHSFVYPFQSGKINYTVTGPAFGERAKEIYPKGWFLMTIPYQALPTLIYGLKEMEWVPPAYTEGRAKFLEREEKLFAGLMEKYQNP
jgi:hypothetical protein